MDLIHTRTVNCFEYMAQVCDDLALIECVVNQAVLETVARVKSKKNDTKEEKYMLLTFSITFHLQAILVDYLCISLNTCVSDLGHLMFSIWTATIELKILLH